MKLGKIYMIISDKGDSVYVGSTCTKYLSNRMAAHVASYKCFLKGDKLPNLSSFKLFSKYGVESCKIILLESCPCDSIDELHAREHYYIHLKKSVNSQRLKCYSSCENKEVNESLNSNYELQKQKFKDIYELC